MAIQTVPLHGETTLPVATAREQQSAAARFLTPPLPSVFKMAMPDESLASIPKGKQLIFDCNAVPRAGHGVLVEDKEGRRHVRRYVVVHGRRFKAEATTDGFNSLDSRKDGLRVLAVVIHKMEDGSV